MSRMCQAKRLPYMLRMSLTKRWVCRVWGCLTRGPQRGGAMQSITNAAVRRNAQAIQGNAVLVPEKAKAGLRRAVMARVWEVSSLWRGESGRLLNPRRGECNPAVARGIQPWRGESTPTTYRGFAMHAPWPECESSRGEENTAAAHLGNPTVAMGVHS